MEFFPRYFNTAVNVNLNFKSHLQNSNMSDTNGNKNRILVAVFTNLIATILGFNFKSNENKWVENVHTLILMNYLK